MRLVVDTNVVISALLWGGTPKALFNLAETTELDFYTSRVLLDEMADVLSRRKLARAISAIDATPASLLRHYQGFARVVQPRLIGRIVPNDPDDDALIACALAARAEIIVSGDKHLHRLGGQYNGIPSSHPLRPSSSSQVAKKRIDSNKPLKTTGPRDAGLSVEFF